MDFVFKIAGSVGALVAIVLCILILTEKDTKFEKVMVWLVLVGSVLGLAGVAMATFAPEKSAAALAKTSSAISSAKVPDASKAPFKKGSYFF